MISKAHILSFIAVLLLYAGVAIWKWAPYKSQSESISSNISDINIDSPVNQFWEFYDQATQLRSQGLYSKAAEQYSKALTINKNHRDALYYAGSMNLMSRNFKSANNHWNQLLQEEPNAPRTNLQLGTLHFCMDRENPYFNLKKAYQFFSEAWELNLEETGAPLLLAKIHLFVNEPKQAEELISDILSLNTTNEQALFLMGYLSWRSGEIQKARQFLSRSRAYVNRDKKSGHLGEGATKSGNAMLLKDRFCDGFEVTFKYLMQNQIDLGANETYSIFDNRINRWRNELKITNPSQLLSKGQ